MSEISVDEHDEKVRELKSMKKTSWILIAVALALTVAAIVGLVVGLKYIPKIYDEGIDNKGVAYKIYRGLKYEKLADILSCSIALVICNFALFVILQESIWINKDTFGVSAVFKIIKAVLHIVAVLLIVILSLVTGFQYISEYAGSSYANKATNIWILGAYGMSTVGEAITLLVYYWNERFARGPAGADMFYLENHKKLWKRSERAYGFKKFYIAVPYVAYLIGFFVSVALGAFAEKLGKVMFGGIQLIVIAIVAAWSVFMFFKKYRLGKSDVRGFRARNSSPKDKSAGSSSFDYSDNDEPKPIDKGYAEGKKRLSSELYEYNGLKFVPYSNDLPTYVSDARLSVQLVNKDSFGTSGKLVLRGNITCKIKREESYPNDAAQTVLDETIDNIKSRAQDILDDLSDKYSNYNKSFTIDCSGIKISYKVV